MRCEEVQEKLDSLNPTDGMEQGELDSHLSSCQPCREFSEDLAAVKSVLDQIPSETIAPEASQKIRSAVAMIVDEGQREDEMVIQRALVQIPYETISTQASKRIRNSIAMMIEERQKDDETVIQRALDRVPYETISTQASKRIHNSVAMLIAEKKKGQKKVETIEHQPTFWERVAAFLTLEHATQFVASCAVVGFAIFTYNFPTDPSSVENNRTLARATVKALPALPASDVNLVNGEVVVSGLVFGADDGRSVSLKVPQNQSVITAKGKNAQLVTSDGVRIAMAGSSNVGVGQTSLWLRAGQTGVHVPKGSPKGSTVHTSRTESTILGTRVLVEQSGRVDLLEGTVRVSQKDTGIGVYPRPGQSVEVRPNGALQLKATGDFRLKMLYEVFAALDGSKSLARDLGITIAELETLKAMGQMPATMVAAAFKPLSAAVTKTVEAKINVATGAGGHTPTVSGGEVKILGTQQGH